MSYQNGTQSSFIFVPSTCSASIYIGSSCNISALVCDMLQPCQNNGTCINNNTIPHGYTCICLPGLNGTDCEYNYRPCHQGTCWNNGRCYKTSNTTFICQCAPGWSGNHCENVKCLNNGVCFPSLLSYTCKCLGDSYSGRHCEITENEMIVRQTISKSFASIAIIAIISAAMFIIIMDLIKYVFNIDPTHQQMKQIQQKKKINKVKAPITTRYVYINASVTQSLRKSIVTVEETTV